MEPEKKAKKIRRREREIGGKRHKMNVVVIPTDL